MSTRPRPPHRFGPGVMNSPSPSGRSPTPVTSSPVTSPSCATVWPLPATTGTASFPGSPPFLAAHPWGSGWSAAHTGPDLAAIDGEVFVRSDELMTAHREMALLDLSAPQDVARVLRHAEEQLTAITERHAAAEARLQQLRAAIIRQYRQGVIRARNRPA